MRINLIFLLVLATGICVLQSCATRDADLVRANHNSAESLIDMASPSLDKSRPILVASIMDVSDLANTSRFGRITADMLSTRMAQLGYTVLELKLDRKALLTMTGSSESLLSNELRNLCASLGAQAVLIGTYAPADERVYVSAKLVRASDNVILAAEDYFVPLDSGIMALIDPDSIFMAQGENF